MPTIGKIVGGLRIGTAGQLDFLWTGNDNVSPSFNPYEWTVEELSSLSSVGSSCCDDVCSVILVCKKVADQRYDGGLQYSPS